MNAFPGRRPVLIACMILLCSLFREAGTSFHDSRCGGERGDAGHDEGDGPHGGRSGSSSPSSMAASSATHDHASVGVAKIVTDSLIDAHSLIGGDCMITLG
jgi:hypothetical protein